MKKDLKVKHEVIISTTGNTAPLTERYAVRYQELAQKYGHTWRELYKSKIVPDSKQHATAFQFLNAKGKRNNLDKHILLSALELIIRLKAKGFKPKTETSGPMYPGVKPDALATTIRRCRTQESTCLTLYLKCMILKVLGVNHATLTQFVDMLDNWEGYRGLDPSVLIEQTAAIVHSSITLGDEDVIPSEEPVVASLTMSYMTALVQKWLKAETIDLLLLYNWVLPQDLVNKHKDRLLHLGLLSSSWAPPASTPNFSAQIPVIIKGVVSVSRDLKSVNSTLMLQSFEALTDVVAVPPDMAKLVIDTSAPVSTLKAIESIVGRDVVRCVDQEAARRIKQFNEFESQKEEELKTKLQTMSPEERAEIIRMAAMLGKM